MKICLRIVNLEIIKKNHEFGNIINYQGLSFGQEILKSFGSSNAFWIGIRVSKEFLLK